MNLKYHNFWRNDIEKTTIGKFFLKVLTYNCNKFNLQNKYINVFCDVDLNTDLESYKDSIKIYYTGENPLRKKSINDITKLYNKFDIVFSYEKTPVNINNKYKHIRLTNWMFVIFDLNNWHVQNIPSETIFFDNLYKYYSKDKDKSSVIICRHDKNNIRTMICDDFKKYTKLNVHYAGPWKNNITKCGDKREDKFNYLKSYIFNICPENSIYDGYNTEKLLDSLITGCIPIYWGDTIEEEYFNKEKILIYDNNFQNNLMKILNNYNYYINLDPFNQNFYKLILEKESEMFNIFDNIT